MGWYKQDKNRASIAEEGMGEIPDKKDSLRLFGLQIRYLGCEIAIGIAFPVNDPALELNSRLK